MDSINDLQTIPLELINSNRDRIRKDTEPLNTLEPNGMNRRDETLLCSYIYQPFSLPWWLVVL